MNFLTTGTLQWTAGVQRLFPGLMVALMIAFASTFISEHYGAPAMLLALLFGISMNFLADHPKCGEGIAFGAKTVLRFGVALLGLRISFDMIGTLGWPVVALVVGMVPLTIGFGFVIARAFGFANRFAFLSAGAVAICGASGRHGDCRDYASGRKIRGQAGLYGGGCDAAVNGSDDCLSDPQPSAGL